MKTKRVKIVEAYNTSTADNTAIAFIIICTTLMIIAFMINSLVFLPGVLLSSVGVILYIVFFTVVKRPAVMQKERIVLIQDVD